MRGQTREHAIMLLALVIVAVLLLAAGLENVEFQPGLPLLGSASTDLPETAQTHPTLQTTSVSTTIQLALAAVFALGLIFLGVILVRKLGRQLLRLDLILLAVLLMALLALPNLLTGETVDLGTAESTTPVPEAVYETTPLGTPPQSFTRWVAAGLGVFTVLIAAWLLRHRPAPDVEEDLLGQEAEKALHSIRSGQDLGEVILRCYLQMSRILAQEQDIERGQAMTAREFEVFLARRGVPSGPIHKLTGLFEAVRYGPGQLSNPEDEQAALDCLESITHYCRETKARPAS